VIICKIWYFASVTVYAIYSLLIWSSSGLTFSSILLIIKSFSSRLIGDVSLFNFRYTFYRTGVSTSFATVDRIFLIFFLRAVKSYMSTLVVSYLYRLENIFSISLISSRTWCYDSCWLLLHLFELLMLISSSSITLMSSFYGYSRMSFDFMLNSSLFRFFVNLSGEKSDISWLKVVLRVMSIFWIFRKIK